VLIGAGADSNLQDKAGWTALMRASLWGHTAAAQALLEAGADRSIRDKVSRAQSCYFGMAILNLDPCGDHSHRRRPPRSGLIPKRSDY
jgi:ankyrin repeat protein